MADTSNKGQVFPETRWTVIQRLRAERETTRREALAQLCQAYWHPLYVLARASNHAPPDAEDFTQSFLAALCARGDLGPLSPEKGRLRSWLKAAFQNHLVDAARGANAQKRGAGRTVLALDYAEAERQFEHAHAVNLEADNIFDQQWANAILQRALAALRRNFKELGKEEVLRQIEIFLGPDEAAPSYAEIGAKLGKTENAVAVMIRRLRAEFRAHLRREVAQTVEREADVDEELRYLVRLLA
ncbi:MAG: sigma-70 family RNA polymerase sigma factor [Verrucomicrobia bacterium]|nr:sigma-70 family RNA polymerase sigma factor [Verrucomicrobiota bacterium]